MADQGRIRIVLIDDQDLFREALARTLALEPDFTVAAHFPSIRESVEFLRRAAVDLVLLDINLGPEQGGAFLAKARAIGYSGKVLVVTAGLSQREAAWLLNRGCSGVFLKTDGSQKLFQQIRSVMSGKHKLDSISVQAILAEADQSEPPGRKLTVRESKVLRCVCEGLTNKEIAERLGISENTVKSFLQQLFAKAGVRTRSQLVRVGIERYWDQVGRDGVD